MTLHEMNLTSSGPIETAMRWTNLVHDKISIIPNGAISLLARIGIAGVFWRSGQTKVDGWEIRELTFDLFRDEYALPLIPTDLAVYAATISEHLFPLLLIAGLASRISAASLLAMTAVIQIFVYPTSWPDHALWATALLFLIARGPGLFSLDHLIQKRANRARR